MTFIKTLSHLIICPFPYLNKGGYRERTRILMGLILGILLGSIIGVPAATLLAIFGDLFMGLLKMIVVPLVLVSVMLGIASNDNIRMVKKVGLGVIGYFLITTTVATTLGSSVTTLFEPGDGLTSSMFTSEIDSTTITPPAPTEAAFYQAIRNGVQAQIPKNILSDMMAGNMLQIVLAAALFGAALLTLRHRRTPLARSADNLTHYLELAQELILTIVHWALKMAPLGVMGIMAYVTANSGLGILANLGSYVLILLGCFICLIAFYLAVVRYVAGANPITFIKNIADLQLMAFSTSSSAAVMPISLKTAEKNGVSSHIAKFIIPLGTTINMDGTALYQAVAAVFLMQIFGVPVTIDTVIAIVGTAILASIGTPGAPGMGLIVLSGILAANGVPAAAVGIIFGIDRPLDMCRTVINVTGDQCAALVMQRFYAAKRDRTS